MEMSNAATSIHRDSSLETMPGSDPRRWALVTQGGWVLMSPLDRARLVRDLLRNSGYQREPLRNVFPGQSTFPLVTAFPALRSQRRGQESIARLTEASGIAGSRTPGGGWSRVGDVVMGAPQIVDGPRSQTTDRERILPDMRYQIFVEARGARSGCRF